MIGIEESEFAWVMGKIKKKHDKAEEKAEKRRKEVFEKYPEIALTERKIEEKGLIGVKIAMQHVGGNKDISDKEEKERRNKDTKDVIMGISEEIEELTNWREELLIEAGLPPNYLEPIFECKLCMDTGYRMVAGLGTGLCDCVKKMIAEKSYEKSGLGALLKKCNFENINLDYYDNHKNEMTKIFNYCKKYAEEFTTFSDSLLMLGGTGLGKTHMTTAIAKTIMDKYFKVVYTTASDLIATYDDERFNKFDKNERKSKKFIECDLLIIDDLGAEYTNAFAISIFYSIINERYNSNMPTIINTNLSQKELIEKYDTRIASRLMGQFTMLKFEGSDIRMEKLKNER